VAIVPECAVKVQKKYVDHTLETKELLNSSGIKVAFLAPSFAAEFTEIIDYKMLINMIK